jgi:hypothetical protein
MKIHIRKEGKLQQISNAVPAGTTMQHLCNNVYIILFGVSIGKKILET